MRHLFLTFILLSIAPGLVLGAVPLLTKTDESAKVQAPLNPDENAAGGIVVLDLDKVLYESDVARYIQEQVEIERSAFQKEVEGYEADLRNQEQALKAKQESHEAEQKPGMTLKESHTLGATGDKDLLAERNKFEANVAEVQKKVSGKGKLLEESFNNARSEVINTVMEIVNKLAKDNTYKIVLPRNAVLYRLDHLDITNQVMEALNNRMKKVDLKLSPKKGA